tara:strand:+ start:45723 stop:46352 length:630 start_codon:yes stop_codon:yes gene_type:complete
MNSFTDKLIKEIDLGLKYSLSKVEESRRKYPAKNLNSDLNDIERDHSAGLMRVNHSGEVCAQALYRGQASTAKLENIKEKMEESAEEELEHLSWCYERLGELNHGPSVLNPLWYAMSFSIGAIAGIVGDKWSLGFVKETENQVVSHLEGHLKNISDKDKRSLSIIKQMKIDEEKHGEEAKNAGAEELPEEVKKAMSFIAKIMTRTSYHI